LYLSHSYRKNDKTSERRKRCLDGVMLTVLKLFDSKNEIFHSVSLGTATYLEIFRGWDFQFFLYGWENLGGFGIFFLKIPRKLKNFSQIELQNPPLNMPRTIDK